MGAEGLMSRVEKPIDEALLIRLWPTDIPEKQLVVILGRCSGKLYRKAGQLGLPGRRFLRAQRKGIGYDKIKRSVKYGKSQKLEPELGLDLI